MKSHSGARKRFKKLKSGLVKFAHANRRHLLSKKSRNRKRNLGRTGYINACDMNHFDVWLPY